MSYWLLPDDVLREVRAALERGTTATAEDVGAFLAAEERSTSAARDDGPRNLAVAGDTAEIRVEGVLVQVRSFWLWLFGIAQTTYADIQQAIAMVQADPAIRSVRFYVDSPGGEVDGLFDTFAAIEGLRASSKTTSVLAANAFSAAYGIAAVAGPIEAKNSASGFGSVGVAASYLLEPDVVDITNTESPDKRPDVSTDEGKAVVQSYLDALFGLFAEAIAKGRGTTVKDVTENFGRGALFVAGDAKRRGMIDTIAKPALRVVSQEAASAAVETAPAEREREQTMDLEQLRSQHPEAYRAAVQEGVRQERDRTCAHLTMGAQSGDLETAHAAIRDGSEMTQELTARYLAAGMRRAAQGARQDDSDAAGDAVDGASTTTTETGGEGDLGDQVAAALAERRGKKLEG